MTPQPPPRTAHRLGLAVGLAIGLTLGVGYLVQKFSVVRAPPKAPARPPVVLPVLAPEVAPVVFAHHERGVPPDVLETADLPAAPWAPGLRLVEISRAPASRHHRAVLEDLDTQDIRRYAIGDLLPHGSILVGISTTSVDLFVADQELVRMDLNGSVESIETFRPRVTPLVIREVEMAPEYIEGAQMALDGTRDPDPVIVQLSLIHI